MIQRLLLILGYPTFNTRRIADRLADHILNEYAHSASLLSEADTKDMIRTRYVRFAVRYGLPVELQHQIANMAWRRIHQATPAEIDSRSFSFYN